MRLREIWWCTQGHTAKEEQSQVQTWICPSAELTLFYVIKLKLIPHVVILSEVTFCMYRSRVGYEECPDVLNE